MKTVEETKKEILEASERLFSHYGFNKTTMAEIAKDCNMSAANIYRFYESKEEILAAMSDSFFRQTEDLLREVLRRPGLTAAERLEAFIVENLRHLDHICSCNTKIDEAVQFIKEKRSDIVTRHMDAKRSMIAEILAEGNRTGEFEADDIVITAGHILTATFLCRCQWTDKCPPLEEVEKSAKGTVRLIVKGLGKR
jgi:AcrR family transcriptional regulator